MSENPKPPPPRPTMVGIGPEGRRGPMHAHHALHVVPDPRRDDTPESPMSAVTDADRLKAIEDGQAALRTSLEALTTTNAEVRELIGQALTRGDNRVTELETHVTSLAGQWVEQLSKVNGRLDELEARQKRTEEDAKAARDAAEDAEEWATKTGQHAAVVLDHAKTEALERRASQNEDTEFYRDVTRKVIDGKLEVQQKRETTEIDVRAEGRRTLYRAFGVGGVGFAVVMLLGQLALKGCGG